MILLAGSRNRVEGPDEFARSQVPRAYIAPRSVARRLLRMISSDGQVFVNGRRRRQRHSKFWKFVADAPAQFHFPTVTECWHVLAGFRVQCDQQCRSIRGPENESRRKPRHARPVRQAARRRLMTDVLDPDLFAGVGIEREDSVVRARDVHHPINHQGRGFRLPGRRTSAGGGLAATCAATSSSRAFHWRLRLLRWLRRRLFRCRFITRPATASCWRWRDWRRRVVGPHQLQLRDVLGVDLLERRIPNRTGVAAVRGPVGSEVRRLSRQQGRGRQTGGRDRKKSFEHGDAIIA